MKPSLAYAACAVVAVTALSPVHARAENGQIAAGIFGGLAAGALLGAATAPRYYAPAPVYIEPEPVYVAPPPPTCYWTRGAPVWDEWRGAWIRPRLRVCE